MVRLFPIYVVLHLIAIAALVCLAFGLTGCVQTSETITATDGTKTERITKSPAPGVLQFAGAAITAYSPRPIRVREEKSGPITAQEIADRFKP